MEDRLLPIGIQDFEYLRKNNYIYVFSTLEKYEAENPEPWTDSFRKIKVLINKQIAL